MNAMLALNAFEVIKHSPNSPSLWQHFSALAQTLEGDVRSTLVSEVIDYPFEGAEADWLRFSALAYLTRDPIWFTRQATIADRFIAPEAVMVLLNLAWHHALVETFHRDTFLRLMRDVNAPLLQRLLSANICAGVHGHSSESGSPLRVAIYTPQVANARHGGTTLTLNSMSVLARKTTDLRTFTAQETSIRSEESYNGGAEFMIPPPVEVESLKLKTSGSFQLILPDTQFSLRSRFDQILHEIHSYAPDVIVFVGLMSPLVFKLYEHYPVVGLSVHALPPIAPVDVWLSADPQFDAACWPSVPVPQVFPFPYRFWPAGQAVPIDRAAVGLPADATLLVTAGFRLETEITSPWREQMLGFLDAHPEVHWLLVGVAESIESEALPQHPRVYRIVPQAKLEAWLAMCDIYVNPPRIGGGGALAMAMEQGLAVATFANSDGGDKVGSYALGSSDEYFAQLETWVSNPAARRQAGDALKVWFHARLDFSGEKPAADLIRACHNAIESFNQRREVTRV